MDDTFSLYTLNLGFSNKSSDLRPDKVVESIAAVQPVVVAFTEPGGSKQVKKITAALNHHLGGGVDYQIRIEKIGYDKAVLLYDAKRVTATKTIVSLPGKYMAVEVAAIQDGSIATFCVTHLPHKKGKTVAINTLNNFLATSPRILGLGDYNIKPDVLPTKLSNVKKQAVVDETMYTTTKNGSVDNMVSVSNTGTFTDTHVLNNYGIGSDHYPVITQWKWN